MKKIRKCNTEITGLVSVIIGFAIIFCDCNNTITNFASEIYFIFHNSNSISSLKFLSVIWYLPDIIAYLLMFYGLSKITDFHPYFKKVRILVCFLILYPIAELFKIYVPSTLLSIILMHEILVGAVFSFVQLLLYFYLILGIHTMSGEMKLNAHQKASEKMWYWLLVGSFSEFIYKYLGTMINHPARVLIILLYLVIQLRFLLYLYRTNSFISCHSIGDSSVRNKFELAKVVKKSVLAFLIGLISVVATYEGMNQIYYGKYIFNPINIPNEIFGTSYDDSSYILKKSYTLTCMGYNTSGDPIKFTLPDETETDTVIKDLLIDINQSIQSEYVFQKENEAKLNRYILTISNDKNNITITVGKTMSSITISSGGGWSTSYPVPYSVRNHILHLIQDRFPGEGEKVVVSSNSTDETYYSGDSTSDNERYFIQSFESFTAFIPLWFALGFLCLNFEQHYSFLYSRFSYPRGLARRFRNICYHNLKKPVTAEYRITENQYSGEEKVACYEITEATNREYYVKQIMMQLDRIVRNSKVLKPTDTSKQEYSSNFTNEILIVAREKTLFTIQFHSEQSKFTINTEEFILTQQQHQNFLQLIQEIFIK